MADPQSLYENLTSASTNDKSRLVGLFFVAILLVLLQPILVASKINQTLNAQGPLESASWFAVLVPYWIMGGLLIVLTFVAAAFVPARERLAICVTGVEQFFWYLGIIFLCLKWDRTWGDSILYRQVLAPVFIAMILRWSRSFLIMHKIRKDVNRMVTSDYIENEFLKGRPMDELPEEEQADIKDSFMVISVDPEFEPHSPDLSSEDLEEGKVEASPEYRAAMDIYNDTFYGLARSLVIGGVFLILLTLKLDDRLNDGANWWAVFSPIWIDRGSRLVFSFYKCLCGGISGEEVVLYAGSNFPTGSGVEGNDADGNVSVNSKTSTDGKGEQEKLESHVVTHTASSETNNIGGESPTETNNNSTEPDSTIEIEKNIAEEKGRDEIKEENNKKETAISSTEESLELEQKTDVEDGSAKIADEYNFFDEGTYHDFESAYAQAENDSKQERAKSCSESCSIIFQLIILCLVVAKIEKSYEYLYGYDDDTGFNVFWILFPFFLIFGCVGCCCALLIFGSTADSLGDETDDNNDNDDDNDNENVVGSQYDPENPPANYSNGNEDDHQVVEKDEKSAPEVKVAAAPVANSGELLAAEELIPVVVDRPPESTMDDLD
mmetsp:Transcript_20731/g.43969  ORF Transcript_20731/g.43969 Transcript_20731/m.43969 type:complete len:608 (-) Transcript_20731:1995-3818(-)